MAGTISNSARSYFDEMSELLRKLDMAPIERLAELLFECWRDRRRVYVFGNGGSAATAGHYVADFVKTAGVDGQKRLMAFCLSDNTAMMTALGNDVCYDQVFAYPLAAYAQAGDLAIAISCSGNSPNILRACEWAAGHGMTVVAITGLGGGKVKDLADVHINIPSDNYGIIEDLHMSVGHVAAQVLKSRVEAASAVRS